MDEMGYVQWRPAFAAAMNFRLYRPEWLDHEIASGRAKFWSSPNAAAVTEIRIYPTGACDIHGLIAAGDAREIRDVIMPKIEAWGRSIGAEGIIIESRPGWARIFKGDGFVAHQLAIRKELGA